jgi:hypothetical protein
MWRTMASLLLNFLAMGWAVLSASVCFFFFSGLWSQLLGTAGAFYGALIAFVLCFLGARLLMRLADKVLEPLSGPFDGSVYRSAPRDTFYKDWQAYAADILRNRRLALYARTRQWEKLAALLAQGNNGGGAAAMPTSGGPNDSAEPPHPRRTSMGPSVTFEENRRGVRRTSQKAARVERWHTLDD